MRKKIFETEEMKEERIRLIMQIFALGYLVQEHTDYCVFMNFSGHVDSFEIDIRESKERYNNEVCRASFKTKFDSYFDYKNENSEGNRLAWLKAKRDVLKEILETGDIPYSEMEEYIEKEYKYNF